MNFLYWNVCFNDFFNLEKCVGGQGLLWNLLGALLIHFSLILRVQAFFIRRNVNLTFWEFMSMSEIMRVSVRQHKKNSTNDRQNKW